MHGHQSKIKNKISAGVIHLWPIFGSAVAAITLQWITSGVSFSSYELTDVFLLIADTGLLFLSYRIVLYLILKEIKQPLPPIFVFFLSLIPGYGIIVFYRWIILLIKLWLLLQVD